MAWQCYQKSANVWHSPTPDFKVGDKVFVKAQFLELLGLQKSSLKNILDPTKLFSSLVYYCSFSIF